MLFCEYDCRCTALQCSTIYGPSLFQIQNNITSSAHPIDTSINNTDDTSNTKLDTITVNEYVARLNAHNI